MQAHTTHSRYQAPRADTSLEARSYDHWHVDLHEPWELEFWMKHLGCDEQALRDAVFEVGARVGAVRAYIASHPAPRR
jgi:hypothetical protein